MRIFFTGGSGKAGRYSVAHLRALGHYVVNADQVSSGDAGPELLLDLTDAGQVIGAMSQFVDFHELDAGTGVPKYDAVVHFAATPRVMIGTDGECFRINTQSTYNVIEAAVKPKMEINVRGVSRVLIMWWTLLKLYTAVVNNGPRKVIQPKPT